MQPLIALPVPVMHRYCRGGVQGRGGVRDDGKRSEMHEMHERRGSRLTKEKLYIVQGGSSKGGGLRDFFCDGNFFDGKR